MELLYPRMRNASSWQGHLKVEGSSPSHPVFHLLPAAASEKREKRVVRVPFTLSPRQRSPHPAKGLAAPLNPALGDFSLALTVFNSTLGLVQRSAMHSPFNSRIPPPLP